MPGEIMLEGRKLSPFTSPAKNDSCSVSLATFTGTDSRRVSRFAVLPSAFVAALACTIAVFARARRSIARSSAFGPSGGCG